MEIPADLKERAEQFREKYDTALAVYEEARGTIVTEAEAKKRHDDNLKSLKYQSEHWQRQMRNALCEYHMRPALALSSLVFALIGVPVGLYFHRADYLSSFVTCFLPAVFVFYPLLLAGSNMGRDGTLPMPVGVYAADAIVGLAALVLIVRLIKR